MGWDGKQRFNQSVAESPHPVSDSIPFKRHEGF